MVGTPSTAAQTDSGLSLAELSRECRFTGHKVVATYERKIDFIYDSLQDAELAAMLPSSASSAKLRARSETFDNGRYRLVCNNYAKPGFISIYVEALKFSGPLDPIPRVVRCQVVVFNGDNPLAVSVTNGSLRFVEHKHSLGWRKTVNFARMHSNADFVSHNRLRFVVKLTETITSDQMEALKAPSFSLSKVASGITSALAGAPSVRLTFPDGEYVVEEQFLKTRCKHFQTALSGGFAEGKMDAKKKRAFSDLVSGGSDDSSTALQEDTASADGQSKRLRSKSPSPQPEHKHYEAQVIHGLSQDSDFSSDSEASSEDSSALIISDESDHAFKRAAQLRHRDANVRQTEAEGPVMNEIKVDKFSVQTFKALMGYFYTGIVTFKGLSSSKARVIPDKLRVNALLPQEWACSAKSLYRMADYYDLPEVVRMCKEAFEDLLTPDCVLKELADSFARLHEPIRTVIESYALEHWAVISTLPNFSSDVDLVMANEESRDAFIRILQKTGANY